MTKIADLKNKWMKNPEFRDAYEGLAPEFEIARALIKARSRAGMTQGQVAAAMGTTQSAVARMEGGRATPSFSSVSRYAEATGTRLHIELA
jgi:predicted transcriptional regulator